MGSSGVRHTLEGVGVSGGNTLEEWILNCSLGEFIEGVVIGKHPDVYEGDTYDEDDVQTKKGFLRQPLNRVLTWEEAREHLRYKFDSGYGGAECNPVYVWTRTRVLFVHEYDGSTGMHHVPRFPMNIEPDFL